MNAVQSITPSPTPGPCPGPAMSLVERLKLAASLWCEATGRSLGALGTVVANHGSFFERLAAPDAGTTTATLEKFARFLVEPGNWPDARVPDDVCRFAHAVGIASAACAVSPDNHSQNIEVPGADDLQHVSTSGRPPADPHLHEGGTPGTSAADAAPLDLTPAGDGAAAGAGLVGGVRA